VDPFTTVGAIAAVVDLAKASGEAIESLRKALPESSRFWKHFEGALKNDRDMPWQEIRSRSYLQPEFFGLSVALVLGDSDTREMMERHFAFLVERPEGGRYDKPELVRRIMLAADKAASEAAASDRDAGLANRNQIESRIRVAATEVQVILESIEQGVARVEGRLDDQAAAHSEFASAAVERLDAITELLAPRDGERSPSARDERLDRGQMQQLLDQQAEKFARLNEATISKLFDREGSRQIEVAATNLAARGPVAYDEAAPVDDGGRLQAASAASKHIDGLADTQPAAATRLRELFGAGGAPAVATGIRRRDFEAGPLELLVAAARIVAGKGSRPTLRRPISKPFS